METITKNVGDIAFVYGMLTMFAIYTVAILRWVWFRKKVLGLRVFGHDLLRSARGK